MTWLMAGCGVAAIALYVVFYAGYVRGYRAGMNYGMAKLDDYHQHTMTNLKSLSDELTFPSSQIR